jgi:hypothetical protein
MSEVDLLATTDASVWARECTKLVDAILDGALVNSDLGETKLEEIEENLVTWFANALVAAEINQTFVEACDQAASRVLFYSIVNQGEADRELALAKTNLEQSQMWFTRALAIIQNKFNPADLEKEYVTESV